MVKGFTTAGITVTVTVAGTGPAALAAAHAGGIDLIVLDIGLPGMDGMTLLRTLRAEGRHCRW